jgi:hypothetical protein
MVLGAMGDFSLGILVCFVVHLLIAQTSLYHDRCIELANTRKITAPSMATMKLEM